MMDMLCCKTISLWFHQYPKGQLAGFAMDLNILVYDLLFKQHITFKT